MQESERMKALNAELKVQIDSVTQRQAKTAFQETEALKRASHFEHQFDRAMHENRNFRNQLAVMSGEYVLYSMNLAYGVEKNVHARLKK